MAHKSSHLSIEEVLSLPTEELSKYCTMQAFQGSGAGGQKRNRKLSGIRITLEMYNLEIKCCEERNQESNKKRALRLLKEKLALNGELQTEITPIPFPGQAGKVNPQNILYALFMYQACCLIFIHQGETKPCAELFKLSHSALIKIFYQNKALWFKVNNMRIQFGKKELRTP